MHLGHPYSSMESRGAISQAEEFSIMVYSLGVLNFRHHDLLSAVVQLVPPALPKFTTSAAQETLGNLCQFIPKGTKPSPRSPNG